MSVDSVFDVFVCDPPVIDQIAYKLWLQGFSVEDTANRRLAFYDMADGQNLRNYYSVDRKRFQDFILQDTKDQFRLFHILEEYLLNSSLMSQQKLVLLAPSVERVLIERYYEFDESVMREFLGKKLSGKLRNKLEQISHRKGITLESCRRQFENLKRIYRFAKDREERSSGRGSIPGGSLAESVEKYFCLTPELASKFSRVVFLCWHRFQTTKRRLSFIQYDAWDKMANVLMTHWIFQRTADGGQEGALALSPAFLDTLHEIKGRFMGDSGAFTAFHNACSQQLLAIGGPNRDVSRLERRLPLVMRAVLYLGSELSKTKESRMFFRDLVDKVLDVCKKAAFSEDDTTLLLNALAAGVPQGSLPSSSVALWETFVRSIRDCVQCLYRASFAT